MRSCMRCTVTPFDIRCDWVGETADRHLAYLCSIRCHAVEDALSFSTLRHVQLVAGMEMSVSTVCATTILWSKDTAEQTSTEW